jgi:hypothetical protein
MKICELLTAAALPPLVLGAALACTAGCQNEEEVLDVETPNGQVEVTRDRETGDLDVDADDDETVLDVDAPGTNVEVRRDEDGGGIDIDATEE